MPISLLSIGYKLFATVLLQRLLAAGAESRVWHTQFGFRSQPGPADAIFVARRLIEQTWSTHEGRLVVVALDWAALAVRPNGPARDPKPKLAQPLLLVCQADLCGGRQARDPQEGRPTVRIRVPGHIDSRKAPVASAISTATPIAWPGHDGEPCACVGAAL